MRILIANRGEIARRIIRTTDRLGLESVAVYAEPDADAPFVGEATHTARLPGSDLATTYLCVEEILRAAADTGADAVHPGYGFLSESVELARAVGDAELVWVGPRPDAIAQMGSKIEARRLAAAAGVPVIPGFDGAQDPDRLRAAASEIGYPVLVKAAAGGGGRGIRVVERPAEFDQQLADARAEAQLAFGDDAVIVERYITRPRHVEVQVVGDRHGHVIDLGTRECSVQRRYQKLLEEAPAPNLSDATRGELRRSAVELARSIGYDSAGTVEFVVDDETGEHFFLEMNTRLQVEHTVTEAITGLDLVELMIDSARGAELPLTQSDIVFAGHAVEARINAEDPAAGFASRAGTITHLRVPDGVRWDSAVESGSVISPHYDSMIAKLVTHGPDRAQALDRMRSALDGLVLGGVPTTAGLHRWLLDQPPIVQGRVTTRYLDEAALPGPPDSALSAAVASRCWVNTRDGAGGSEVWAAIGPFRTTPHRPVRRVLLHDEAGTLHQVQVEPEEELPDLAVIVDPADRTVAVNDRGHTHTFRVITRSEAWAPAGEVGHGHALVVVAPFPAVVAEIKVGPGATVAGGDVVVVVEAMKMLHPLTASGSGTVDEVRVAAGDQIESDQVLVTFRAPTGNEPEPAGG